MVFLSKNVNQSFFQIDTSYYERWIRNCQQFFKNKYDDYFLRNAKGDPVAIQSPFLSFHWIVIFLINSFLSILHSYVLYSKSFQLPLT